MFCPSCGTSLAGAVSACPSCNAPTGAARAAAVTDTVKAAWGTSLGALKRLAGDPVGRLGPTFEALGDEQARRVGLTYGFASLLLFLLGGYLLFPFREGLFDFLGFGGVMKCLLFGLLPFAGTALGSLTVRKLLGGQGSLGGDLFVSGTALLPISLAMPLNGLLGTEHYTLMAILSVAATCTSVLLLFAGYSRITRLSERAATLAIPLVVVLVFWLGKTVASSVLEGGMGGGMGRTPQFPGFEGFGGY